MMMQADPVALDRDRVTTHLRQTEVDLRAKNVAQLSEAQQRARSKNLDALHRYWVRGVYPHNTDVPGIRVPVFIDHDGRACAVGQLMIDSGAEGLAQRIAQDERLEYLATIETAGVGAWIGGSGLTFAELARIQPSYCGCSNEPLDPVCGQDGETYPNPCMATECAGVEIEHEGPCEGNSESGNAVTEGATTGVDSTSSSGGSDTGASGGSSSNGSTSSATTSASTSSDGGASTGDEPAVSSGSGCRVAGEGSEGALALLLLGWRRRR